MNTLKEDIDKLANILNTATIFPNTGKDATSSSVANMFVLSRSQTTDGQSYEDNFQEAEMY